jgi:iron complex outermembrane receptor protein
MNYRLTAIMAGASLLTLASHSLAQAAPAAAAAAAASEETQLGEIVVTARRKSESLQDVPQTVNAVTSDSLQKLTITQFSDVQRVVPGLALDSRGNNATASLRGVSFDQVTGAQPTVALYLNDAPVNPGILFQPMYDIGQVEVLKGPQGTTRGVAAPSGAITVILHKPDLSSFGGYASTTLTDQHGRNVQGAINIPLIRDVMALRAAGSFDVTDADGVRSIHSAIRPRAATSSERLSWSFEPSDVFNANVTYQHLDRSYTNFEQVSGPGQGTALNPALTPEMRASVADQPSVAHEHQDNVITQIDSRLFGQHLSYVGFYTNDKSKVNTLQDGGNLLPGIELFQFVPTRNEHTSQEIRIASDPAPGRFFDYVVGAFYSWRPTLGVVSQPGPLTPGAFGATPGVINLSAFNPAYQVPIAINLDQTVQETSLFGNVTFHLGQNTELSGGVRHIWSIANYKTEVLSGNGLISFNALGLGALPCSVAGLPAGPNPGDCVLEEAGVRAAPVRRFSETPNIYNVSLSHHFTRDLLAYVNTGTSYRPPVASVGIIGALVTSPLPQLDELTFHPSERSRSYEIGFKATVLDGRARLNGSVFRQRFHNLPILGGNVSYLQVANDPTTATNYQFTNSVDALVQGFDLDGALQITPEWNISAQFSYADAKVEGSQVTCNLTDAAGHPVYNTAGLISFCPGGSASRLPLWNMAVQSEYLRPVTDNVDGFLRGLLTYYPQNNRVEPGFVVNNYSLINLYAGVRSHDGAWEASLFVRNAFETKRATDISPVQDNLNTSLSQFFPSLARPSGYYTTILTPPREVGLSLRYAWGSR